MGLGKGNVSDLRTSKLTGTVQWDDGTNFGGYVKLVVSMPTDDSASEWTELYRKPGESLTPVELPQWAVIPITDGAFNQSVGPIYNADMVPHNTKYTATYYDQSLKLIAGPTATFTVSSATTAPPIPTLPSPNAPA